MNDPAAYRMIRIFLAAIVLQSPCNFFRTGYQAIDEFIDSSTKWHQKTETNPDRFEYDGPLDNAERRDQWDWENYKPSWEVEEPQGEFVAPVAPVAPAGQAAPPPAAVVGAPVILSTHFPSPIPADGQWHYGWIDFTDSNGDVTTLKIEIMWTTAPVKGPGATRDAEIEGSPTAGKVRMRFT